MSGRAHLAAVALLGIPALAGLALWDAWGAYVWLADVVNWCG